MQRPPPDSPPGQRPDRRPARRPAGAAPTAARLHDAALLHLSRYAATEAGLLRVLARRVDRWARTAADEGADPDATRAAAARARADAATVVARLAQSGMVNDAAYAASRARSLGRTGHSRRAIGAHLAARGVPAELARAAIPDGADTELAAAVAHAKRRRLGPFAPPGTDPSDADDDPTPDLDYGDAPAADPRAAAALRQARQRRVLAGFARAGFSQDVAARVLRLDRDTAERLLHDLRSA
ncbi:MAG: RecX family transcriptional regulator [Janthinobacterium lividum]